MRCLRCILLFALTAAVLSLCAAAAFVAFVPGWLAAGVVPVKADAIVVLAGAPERVLYAADLYREGFAARVLLSRPAPDAHRPLLARFGLQGMPEAETNLRILTLSGVPAQQIEMFGAGFEKHVGRNGVAEGLSARARARARGHLSAARAPGRYDSAQCAGRKPAGDDFVATPYERIPARRWIDQDAARSVVLEVTKVVFYLFGGGYRAAGNPS